MRVKDQRAICDCTRKKEKKKKKPKFKPRSHCLGNKTLQNRIELGVRAGGRKVVVVGRGRGGGGRLSKF